MRSIESPSSLAVRVIIACIAMFFAASCATTPVGQVSPITSDIETCGMKIKLTNPTAQHVVVNDHGDLVQREDVQIPNIITQLDEFKKKDETKDPKGKKRTILIFVHGGLTTEGAAEKLANDISKKMGGEEYFPLFFIWRTGAFETYWEQSACVRDGVRSKSVQWWDTPLYIFADIGQGLVRAPLIYIKQLQRVIERHQASRKEGWLLDEEEEHYEPKKGPVAANNNLIFAKDTVDKHDVDPNDMNAYVAVSPFRILASPLVDGLGRTAWENMVRRARTTIHKTEEFEPGSKIGSSRGEGGFSKVFGAVGEWLLANNKAHEFRVTLIGHSMGAIVLNELIRTYEDKDWEYDDIVYMGAAASIRDLNRVIVPYLRRHLSARFYNLMLHPLNEAWELNVGGFVPSGSLLEWVDEMYEPPKTMLDRTLGKWRNVKLAKKTVDEDAQKHMVFKVFGGNVDKPRMHGEFNDADTCFWNPWFWVDEDFDWKDWNTTRPDPNSFSKCRDRMQKKSTGE